MNAIKATKAAEMYAAGRPVQEIAETVHFATRDITRAARAAGVPLRGQGRGPNALSWTQTIWNLKDNVTRPYIRMECERWDLDRMIAVSEARNALTASCGCDGFVTPYFTMPSAQTAMAA